MVMGLRTMGVLMDMLPRGRGLVDMFVREIVVRVQVRVRDLFVSVDMRVPLVDYRHDPH